MSHTPTPWDHVVPSQRNYWGYEVVGQDSLTVCELNRRPGGKERAEADAKLIVKCVNMHDELVAALRGLLALRNENGEDGTYTPQGAEARRLLRLAEEA